MIENLDVGRVRRVLDGLAEQLVIRCDHRHRERTLSIVTPWPRHAATANFAFVRFELEGVRDFRLVDREGAEVSDRADERTLVIAGTFVPEGVRGARALGIGFHGGRHVAALSFGNETVSATVRHARVEGRADHRYFDLASGKEIAWADPFAEGG